MQEHKATQFQVGTCARPPPTAYPSPPATWDAAIKATFPTYSMMQPVGTVAVNVLFMSGKSLHQWSQIGNLDDWNTSQI